MSFEYKTDPSGYVEVVGPDGMQIFAHVLNDCIGSRAPRGAPTGLSTYWIDEALKEFRPHLIDPTRSASFSGNASYLELVDGLVEARFDYDPPDSDIVERLPLGQVIELLEAWRIEVLLRDPQATERVPPPGRVIALGPPE